MPGFRTDVLSSNGLLFQLKCGRLPIVMREELAFTMIGSCVMPLKTRIENFVSTFNLI